MVENVIMREIDRQGEGALVVVAGPFRYHGDVSDMPPEIARGIADVIGR